ncbi:MAG: right-handed parallel beta-helix repeat-containing protein [Planctomycetota bacterium]
MKPIPTPPGGSRPATVRRASSWRARSAPGESTPAPRVHRAGGSRGPRPGIWRHVLALTAGVALVACSSSGRDPFAENEDAGDGPAVQEPVPKGPRIRQISAGSYVRPAPSGSDAALVLRGFSDQTLDLTGVELRGQEKGATIDRAAGWGILLSECENVTIKGGVLGGYKACIVVEDCKGVTIDGTRFDGWYGQRLRSTTYAEDQSDWIYPHKNDDGEWISRYGGAIAVDDSTGITIKNCRGRRGQNGILLNRVWDSEVYDNDFSFLSGWGLGMYRSSQNVVSHNVFDYCVRGYSHDVYWRGQDSAGILMFESCSRNVIARNSATHGGDGVFLYAGNDLVERGLETATGCDDNIFLENDLRYAVANSLEATFSSGNAVLFNDLSGSHQHGIWGGYSSGMVILGNRIAYTLGGGVTIEHGQDCLIADNRISGSEVGVQLYWDDDVQFVRGPYGQVRDTLSRDHWILQNKLADNVLDFILRRTTGLVFHGNEYVPGTREPYFENVTAQADPTLDRMTVQRWLDALDGSFPSGNLNDVTLNPWLGIPPEELETWRKWTPPDVPGTQEIRAENRDEAGGGLESIVMGEFGPWDFRSGEPRPERRKPGGDLADTRWEATWFRWQLNESDPRTAERLWRNRASAPIVSDEVGVFVNPWANDDIRREVGNDFFGLFARTTVRIDEGGAFALSVVSDDGIRVFVDEQLVIEDWTLHASKRDEALVALDRGEHTIRIEYFQVQGAAALVLDLSPR